MFKKSKILIPIAVLSIVGGMALHGCRSHRHCGSPEKNAERIVKKISRELDLNDQQKQKLDNIKDDILVKRNEFKGTREQIFNQILNQVESNKVDQEALKNMLESNEAKMKDMHGFLIEKFAEFHSILTPDQRTKLADKMKTMHDRIHG
jgi:Spy/CpxP family protein refolding chaperone